MYCCNNIVPLLQPIKDEILMKHFNLHKTNLNMCIIRIFQCAIRSTNTREDRPKFSHNEDNECSTTELLFQCRSIHSIMGDSFNPLLKLLAKVERSQKVLINCGRYYIIQLGRCTWTRLSVHYITVNIINQHNAIAVYW